MARSSSPRLRCRAREKSAPAYSGGKATFSHDVRFRERGTAWLLGHPVAGSRLASATIPPFLKPMEAERINQIASSLADLQTRAAELRRYL